MYCFEDVRQRYLDLIHTYLRDDVERYNFCVMLRTRWAQDRQECWEHALSATAGQRCRELELRIIGEQPVAGSDDPRRFCRMVDRISAPIYGKYENYLFRAVVRELVACERRTDGLNLRAGQLRYIACPAYIGIFEREIPEGCGHAYPCSVADIRRQLARVPEYDLEGIWAIGLMPGLGEDGSAYGVYYARYSPMNGPVIRLNSRFVSSAKGYQFRMNGRWNPGHYEQRFFVEQSYGMEIVQVEGKIWFRWPADCLRRFMVEHVLLHEIGHHVEYRRRWRARLRWDLGRRLKEQFAEDYAIRFNRELARGKMS